MTHTIRIEKQSGHNASAADENDIFPVQILRKRLYDGEITPPNLRYDETCDCIQSTPDGGTTWIDDPGQDPRHDDGFRLPVLTTSDPQCDAAANMAAYVEFYINSILDAGNYAFVAATTTIDLALIVTGIGVLADLVLIVAEAIIGIGLTTIGDEFTSDVYDQLLCIFYCHISADGSVSSSQLDAIKTDIDSDIGGIPAAVMDLLITLWGEVILSNAGAAGSETGDCSDCSCCPTWFGGHGGMSDWTFWPDDGACAGQGCGTYDSGNDRIVSLNCSNGVYRGWITRTLSSVSSISIEFDIPWSGGTYGLSIYDVTAAQYLLLNSHTSSPGGVSGITGRNGHQFIIMATRTASDNVHTYINKVTVCP